MKIRHTIISATVALLMAVVMSSCIGKFALFNKLRQWNSEIGTKWTNELVFVAFWIIPVYEVAGLADLLVVNSIEFWSGENPVACGSRIIDGEDGRYTVNTDPEGYTIISHNNGSKVRLDFDLDDKTWSVSVNDEPSIPFMTFVDDSHVRMICPDGAFRNIELSENGVMAYNAICQPIQLMAYTHTR